VSRAILLDLNVALDVFLDRQPQGPVCAALWATALASNVRVVFPAHGVTTVFYLAARHGGRALARRVVSDLLEAAEIATVDAATLRRAAALGWSDFEDAVCAVSAEASGCDLLVTRDPRDFEHSPVLPVDPTTAQVLLGGGTGGVAEARAVYGAQAQGRPGLEPPRGRRGARASRISR
jgi:predicted nucleic acid-binding protein